MPKPSDVTPQQYAKLRERHEHARRERETIEHELLTFPHGTHDDIVDCFSYAAADVHRYGSPSKPQAEIDAERRTEAIAELERREEIERLARDDPFDDRLFGMSSGND